MVHQGCLGGFSRPTLPTHIHSIVAATAATVNVSKKSADRRTDSKAACQSATNVEECCGGALPAPSLHPSLVPRAFASTGQLLLLKDHRRGQKAAEAEETFAEEKQSNDEKADSRQMTEVRTRFIKRRYCPGNPSSKSLIGVVNKSAPVLGTARIQTVPEVQAKMGLKGLTCCSLAFCLAEESILKFLRNL